MTLWATAGGQVGDALVQALDDSDVSPGVLGFVVVALLGLATWLLIRSMNKQLRRIDIPDTDERHRTDDGPDADAAPPGAVEGKPARPRSPGDG